MKAGISIFKVKNFAGIRINNNSCVGSRKGNGRVAPDYNGDQEYSDINHWRFLNESSSKL
jgi:hypothetical protein